jgi:phosphoribosylformimino-5-aminoimidazole carboxamide ribotide isomerase
VLIIPAIDLKDGRCVRLQQGDMNSATVFSEDPVAMAKHWAAQGARRLHVVDLNGAVAGRPKNEKVIREMIKAVGEAMPIQLGGGIRDLDTIESYIDAGVTYVVIGTAAVKNPGFLSDASYAFPGHIIAGLDAKDGKVAVEGWSKMTGHDVADRPRAVRRQDRLQEGAGGRRQSGRKVGRWASPSASFPAWTSPRAGS